MRDTCLRSSNVSPDSCDILHIIGRDNRVYRYTYGASLRSVIDSRKHEKENRALTVRRHWRAAIGIRSTFTSHNSRRGSGGGSQHPTAPYGMAQDGSGRCAQA
jgi:hypothetical protein